MNVDYLTDNIAIYGIQIGGGKTAHVSLVWRLGKLKCTSRQRSKAGDMFRKNRFGNGQATEQVLLPPTAHGVVMHSIRS